MDTRLLLQLGFSYQDIEEAIAANHQSVNIGKLLSWLEQHKKRVKQASFSWQPTANTLDQLEARGYILSLVRLKIPEYHYAIQTGAIKPLNLDRYFEHWIMRQLPTPQQPVSIQQWTPGRQLLTWRRQLGVPIQLFNDKLVEYRALKQNASSLDYHEQQFVKFFDAMSI